MEFLILGPLDVRDGERPVPVGAGRQRALLALLLLHANEPVSIDRLVEELWDREPPATAVKIVQGYVSELRKALERVGARGGAEGVLVTRPPGYVLRVDPAALDASRFEGLAAEGRRMREAGAHADAAAKLREALALWRGDALTDFAFERFAQGEIRRLEELRLVAVEDRIEADLALGRHAEVVAELEALTGAHPLRERLRGQLMLALYRSGRQAEALEAYREARQALVDDLGLEPGDELQRLERAILTHDSALAAPRPAARQRRAAPPGARERGTAGPRSGGKPATAVVPNSVALVDRSTNRVVGCYAVGSRPVAVAVAHGSVWVANADDGTVCRIDPRTGRVVKTIGIGAPAIDLAAAPDALWVANGSEGTVSRIDPRLDAVVATIDLRGPDELLPDAVYGVTASEAGVWVASGRRRIMRLDPALDEPVDEVEVGHVPVCVAAGAGSVWAATLGKTALRIEPRTGAVTGVVSIGLPVALVVGEDAAWIASSDDCVWRIDSTTSSVTRVVPVGRLPVGVAVDSGALWVANNGDGTLTRIDPVTSRLVRTVQLGYPPTHVAVGERGVWVALTDESITWVRSGCS